MKDQQSSLIPYLVPNVLEAGCDEVGRGSLAGPVYAAAVIFPPSFRCDELNDSKLLSDNMRYKLRDVIEDNAIAWAVGAASTAEIDEMNIQHATFLAMHRAIDLLKVRPEHLIIDGNIFKPYPGVPYKTVVRGDSQYMSIAAASILAKTYRDDYMKQLSADFPLYKWSKNKGYPTIEHRKTVIEHGLTEHHRRTFKIRL
ncbi:MAG: ribonuclease HII [Tannerellaceae bacterium]|nr:ribonuclease HII [Tannerellaceae bacterium]